MIESGCIRGLNEVAQNAQNAAWLNSWEKTKREQESCVRRGAARVSRPDLRGNAIVRLPDRLPCPPAETGLPPAGKRAPRNNHGDMVSMIPSFPPARSDRPT